MSDFNYKLDISLFPKILKINNPIILELGVETGRSTKKFLEICKKNQGTLYSIDIDDCSNVSNDQNWKFYQTRDDNFDFIKSKIPNEIDVVFIDTLHEADHVEKIIYAYYDLIKVNGYLFIDDVSHLPYVKNSPRENFYCEINNKETFNRILEIYNQNQENFDLEFCFISSGLSIIKKKNNNKLNQKIKIFSKEYRLKNFLRKTWKKIKN
jgi:predicted O-methyltransferase YrrM|tara:strand:- start:14629 stop:15258 length:630 start_codon:yes stop_codon:yes gene_type:complete